MAHDEPDSSLDPQQNQQAGDEEFDDEFEDEGPAPTPFDHPLFLPGLLFAFSLWFGYDGWFNPDMEYIQFNRWGFAVLAALTAWFGYKGFKELREEREADPSRDGDDSARG